MTLVPHFLWTGPDRETYNVRVSHPHSAARRLKCVLVFASCLAALGHSQTPLNYVLGPQDELTITVLRHPEFSGDYLIPTSGTIQIPAAGDIQVIDLTIPDVQRKVTDLLKVRLLKPEVTVKLKTARKDNVHVLGSAVKSGTVDIQTGWGIAETLSAAGGLNSGIEQKDVVLTLEPADGRERISMPLDKALALSGKDAIKVAPGDVVRFEAVASFPVYLTGKVRSPGMYLVREDQPGLLPALARAGGLTDDASMGNVRIVRLAGGEETVDLVPALVRGEKAKLPRLNPGDMVIVSESLARYVVMGYVGKPGAILLPQGRPTTLSDAVAEAGGGDKRARLSKVGLLHTENGKQVKKIYDLNKFLKDGDASQNPIVRAGDIVYVPETNHVDTSTVLGSLSSAFGIFNFLRL